MAEKKKKAPQKNDILQEVIWVNKAWLCLMSGDMIFKVLLERVKVDVFIVTRILKQLAIDESFWP